MIDSAVGTQRAVASRTGSVRELIASLRVKQWTKNGLLFAGVLFAAKLGDPGRWADACLAFAVYCAASSAAYLVNDVRDAELDRLHPTKRLRPVAAGRLTPRAGLYLSAALAVGALSGAVVLGAIAVVLVAGFIALQLLYSFGFKLIVALDVLTIAALFTIRAAAGAEAIRVRVSPWLLVCTALLALFLALAKRRGELDRSREGRRRVLARYSLGLIDRLLVVVSAGTIATYSAYAITARHSFEMAVTIPFVAAAIARYFVLIHRDGLGEQPEEILVTDLPILFAIGSWAVTAALVLTLT
jgi:4-hydroxybenzoate polyprenyltransferase